MKTVVIYQTCALIALAGIALITAGSISFLWFDLMIDIMKTQHFSIPITAISLGCLMVLIPLGMLKIFSMKWSVVTYVGLILLLAVLGTLVLSFHKTILESASGSFAAAFLYRNTPEPRRIVDTIQQNLECCGENDPQSWGPIYLPTSCCPGNVQCDARTAFTIGCMFKINDVITRSSELVAWSGLGFAIFMLLTGFCTLLAYYKSEH